MNNHNFNEWINLGIKKGLSDIEIQVTEKTDLSINVYNQKVEQNEISKMKTAKIKGIYNDKIANISIENLNNDNIDKMLDHLIDSAKHVTAIEPALIYEGSDNYLEDTEERFDFSKVNPLDKVNLLLEIEKEILKHELVKTVSDTSYNEVETRTQIVNSKGLNLERHNTYAIIYTSAAYEKDEQVKSGLSYQIVKTFNEIDKDYLIKENIKDGTSQLGASSIGSKNYPIILDSEQMGSLLSVFTGIFSGEAAFRKLTKLIGKEGTKIASKNVNLIDSPMHDKAIFKYPFDNEGVACKERHWIKDGVFQGFSHNLKTAEIFKTKSTGNGFYNTVSPTNLTLKSEDYSFDDLVKSIDEGVYITSLVGLHAGVETVSGDFSLQAAGFYIKDGKIGRPVDMIVLSGNFFDLLNDIDKIANDFKFGMSGVGTGSVKIKQLMVAGE